MQMDKASRLFASIVSLTEIDNYIIGGDFNLPEKKNCGWRDFSSDDKFTQEFLDLVVDNDIIQLVHFKSAASGTLDIISTSKNLASLLCEKSDYQINRLSNHFGVVANVKFKSKLTYLRDNIMKTRLSICEGDYDLLNRIIEDKTIVLAGVILMYCLESGTNG